MSACGCDVPYIGPSLATACYGGTYVLFMALVDSLVRDRCDISDLCQRVTPRTEPDADYDFVVIGGGSAGSVVAGRLSENPDSKVLLIEAGPDEPPALAVPAFRGSFMGDPSLNWNYRTEPQQNACLGLSEQRCNWPRAKILGGCGVIHGMMYMRGTTKDYDNWEALGNPGWGYESILPYFMKSEGNQQIGTLVNSSIHGADGPMTVSTYPYHPPLVDDLLEAAREVGYPVVDDINQSPYSGFTIAQANILNGQRMSTTRAFVRASRDRPNLHVMVNSTATRVILNTTTNPKRISQVEFIYNDQTFTVNVLKEAIVSSGAINSPQILLLSGIGPIEELDKVGIEQVHDLPGVGQNIHNHIDFNLRFVLNNLTAINHFDFITLSQYLQGGTGPLASTGLAQFTGRLTTPYGDPEGDDPDMQFFFGGLDSRCSRTGDEGEPENLNDPDAPLTISILPVLLKPKSRGYIGLRSSNPLDQPLMAPNYLSVEDDITRLIAGIRIVEQLTSANSLKEKYDIQQLQDTYGDCAERFTYDTDEFWLCSIGYGGPDSHQAGSCRMGPSTDLLAVVDPELKVHGIDGLSVIDSSIMPTLVSGNPHATIVMIAEKGSDLIKARWAETTVNKL